MTPERHQQVKRLFLAAVELTPPDADRYLEEACRGDLSLRQEVESLLSHHNEDTLLPAQSGEATSIDDPADFPASHPRADAPQNSADEPIAVHSPGTIINGRYRLVASLGRGGMGIVYRAEDLELNQTVALKFLSPRLKDISNATDMLRREVRIARQITHPNVVRVFDIGTADGEVFVSMEYVAGENLELLVRRIGHLTADKLVQVAWQLAAGLAAAHDSGILHRDLKPANVMLDGNGNVRILDFGIAAALDDRMTLRTLAGTPGFVAPEMLAGHTPTPRSDLYTWGLVVYYAATGKLPPLEMHGLSAPTEDLLRASGVDAELVSLVCACLQSNPSLRPRSAHELVVGLSAGDPLRAAVEAGRCPAPDLLIASPSWHPSSRLLNGLLAGGLALLVLVILLADRTLFLSRCGLAKSPDALQEIAEKTLLQLGWPAPQPPVAVGLRLDTLCLQFVWQHVELSDPWGKIRAGQFPAVFFSYRQGDPRLPRPSPLGEPDRDRLAQPIPGTASVQLDGHGRLLSLAVGVVSRDADKSVSNEANWRLLFEAAGLKLQDFSEVPTSRWPPLYADEVHTWEGPHPAEPKLRLRITAAALQNRVVFFDIDQPWEQAQPKEATTALSGPTSRFVATRTAVWLITIGLAAGLAWYHNGRGYADQLGAWRGAATVMFLAALHWLLGARHTWVVAEELTVGFLWLNVIVFSGVVAGVSFLAVEPAARRWWPWAIITARRLLAGRWFDREIWADLLLGLVVGLGAVAMRQIAMLLSSLLAGPVSGLNDFDLGQDLLASFGLRYKAAILINALLFAVMEALLLLSLVVGLQRLTRSTLTTAVVLVISLASLAVLGRGTVSPADWTVRALLWTITAWLLIRGGLLATIAAFTTFYVVNNTPLTLDLAAWYAQTSFFIVSMLIIGLIVCWHLAKPRHTFPHPASE